MKKNICLIIAASLILTMTGCGSSASKDTADTASATTAAADTAKGTVSETDSSAAPEIEAVREIEEEPASSEQETQDSAAEESEESGEKSEAEKFMEEFRGAFKSYSEPLTNDFYTALQERDFESARKALETSKAGLETLEKLDVPEKYAELHAKFIETLGTERENLEYMSKYTDYFEKYSALVDKPSPTEEETKELKEFTEEMEKLNKQAEKNSANTDFSSRFMEVIMAVQADIDSEKAAESKGESGKE